VGKVQGGSRSREGTRGRKKKGGGRRRIPRTHRRGGTSGHTLPVASGLSVEVGRGRARSGERASASAVLTIGNDNIGRVGRKGEDPGNDEVPLS